MILLEQTVLNLHYHIYGFYFMKSTLWSLSYGVYLMDSIKQTIR